MYCGKHFCLISGAVPEPPEGVSSAEWLRLIYGEFYIFFMSFGAKSQQTQGYDYK